MKAIQLTQTGGPEVLNLVDIPTPKPKTNEVLVQIKAAGVNFVDIYFREGRYPAQLPLVLGQEAAGVVVETGSDVKQIKTGDRVAYSAAPGAYAEYAAVPAHLLVKIPEKLDFEQAAAAMLQGMTAHYLCRSTYPLKRGETALIHAAAGGVGLLLVQMAHQIGARIIATVSSEEKAALARSAGADHVVLYTRSDFETETKKITANEGVHVVYDSVGKTTFDKGLNVLRRRGYMVLFGGSSGPVPPLDLILLSQKGSPFVTRPTLADYIATREELEWRAGEVLGMVAEGKLKVRIAHRYPLAQAQQAHRDLQGRKTTGKLLLLP
jgi:NADPH2:quinone reductase